LTAGLHAHVSPLGVARATARIARSLALAAAVNPSTTITLSRTHSTPSAESNHRCCFQANCFAGACCPCRQQRAPATAPDVPAAVRCSRYRRSRSHRCGCAARRPRWNFKPQQVRYAPPLARNNVAFPNCLSRVLMPVPSGSSCSCRPPLSAPFSSTSTQRNNLLRARVFVLTLCAWQLPLERAHPRRQR
jgi:hypothetical protein